VKVFVGGAAAQAFPVNRVGIWMTLCWGCRRIVSARVEHEVYSSMRPPMASRKRQDTAEQIATYCDEHPRSPSAVRRPRLILRGQVWIALIGESVQRGIAGFGPTIEAALRAFDRQYLNALRPPPGPKKATIAVTEHKRAA
jgi:hypothetical protein